MKSPLWARRKNAYFQRHGKVCEACRDSKYVTLHHTIYRNNYGNEPDSEVVALCHKCHREFHKFCPAKKDMRKETQEFLEDMWAISQGLKELNSHSKGL
jgi:5-methylcytosine-specific restriction endonuclease McrA